MNSETQKEKVMSNEARGNYYATRGTMDFYIHKDGFTTNEKWVCDVHDTSVNKTLRSWAAAPTKTKLARHIDAFVNR